MMQDNPHLSTTPDSIPDEEITYVVVTFSVGGTDVYGPFNGSEEAWEWVRTSDTTFEAHVLELQTPREPLPF